MKKVRQLTAMALVAIEGVLTLPVFLLAWWTSAIYRSVIAGYTVSGLKAGEKREALQKMMGDNADAG